MDETIIVIMLKDEKTGFFDKELGCYKIDKYEQLIYNVFALRKDDDSYVVYINLTCHEDVSNWEFNAIFDYYDYETLMPFVTSIKDEENLFNPAWCVSFDFSNNQQEMERVINSILAAHNDELQSVYSAISDKKGDYIDECK